MLSKTICKDTKLLMQIDDNKFLHIVAYYFVYKKGFAKLLCFANPNIDKSRIIIFLLTHQLYHRPMILLHPSNNLYQNLS